MSMVAAGGGVQHNIPTLLCCWGWGGGGVVKNIFSKFCVFLDFLDVFNGFEKKKMFALRMSKKLRENLGYLLILVVWLTCLSDRAQILQIWSTSIVLSLQCLKGRSRGL